jgi:ABC-2 type transport system permease protein
MKLLSVIKKSAKEQVRHFWILMLTVSMAPFFVFVYYLIMETTQPRYDLLVINHDRGYYEAEKPLNYGYGMVEEIKKFIEEHPEIPLRLKTTRDREKAIKKLESRKADALVIIPADFSRRMYLWTSGKEKKSIHLEVIGDLTHIEYMVSAIWANEVVNDFVYGATGQPRPFMVKETPLGGSGAIRDFDLLVPGIIMLSVIMLMFTATIAVVGEVENKTMIRLKLSGVSGLEFLTGVSLVQVAVGIVAVLLTLGTAMGLGFKFAGSMFLLVLLVVLTSISIIAFSLILAALTKTVNEVLVVGNFPLFLFMFFTGAAFPIQGKTLFTIFGYPFTIQGLMSPTHSIKALSKVLVLNKGFSDILPEITVLIVITVIYFVIGVWAFQRRHMRLD